jgi:hypothetical protein
MSVRNILARFYALYHRPRLRDEQLAELAGLVGNPTVVDLANDPTVELAELPPKIRAAIMVARAGVAARAGQISPEQAIAVIADALRVVQEAGKFGGAL